MKKDIYILTLIGALQVFLLGSCDEERNLNKGFNNSLIFTGRIYDSQELETRGPISSNISYEYYWGYFYLDMFTENVHKRRPYVIPIKQPGVLRSFGEEFENDTLQWESKYGNHTFYVWTLPWLKEKNEELQSEEEQTIISFNEESEMYSIIKDPEDENRWFVALEKFIGAKAGPLSYSMNGEYVNFQFQHLVSKIHLKSIKFSYTNSNGKLSNDDVGGKIIFEGLPERGFFIRNGEDRPEVKADPESKVVEYSFSKGVSKTLYICPDIDFSEVKFRIYSPDVTDAGDFLGDFSALKFIRDENDWWDNTHSNPTILYAGEEMTLNITLRQGIGTDVSLSISSWRPQSVREAGAYPYEGIYQGSDWNELNSFATGNYDEQNDLEERLFSKYGDPNSKEFNLYTDIDGVKQRIKAGRNHVLNGMGHTITFSEYYDEEKGKTVRISRMRDVYLMGPDGITVYIDENFELCQVKADGTLVHTGNYLEPLEEGKNSYIINFEELTVTQNERI